MTDLTNGRRVVRQTAETIRDRGRTRPLIVALEPWGLTLRPKGCRYTLRLPWGAAWQRAVWLEAEAKRREKAERRKGRKV